VDALRESFVDGSFINYVGNYNGYRMKLFKDLKNEYGDKLKMYTSIADMPTITNQRIKAISTGTLPSTFEMGGNMGSSEEVLEDSVIHQARAHNLTIRMYGDDFWIGHYPDTFDDYEVFPSLDITDLDSNDRIVRTRLLDQLENHTDWDILWTHVLGIDHAGHSFNNLGPELEKKLKDVEDLLSDVVDKLPFNATLAILSDHGLTPIGNHGGPSPDERYTFISFFQKDLVFQQEPMAGGLNPTVSQSSICSTLSALAQVNFPYSNIGSWIPEVISFKEGTSQIEKSKEQLRMFTQNQIQVYNYLKDYLKHSSLMEDHAREGVEQVIKNTTDQLAFLDDYLAHNSEVYSGSSANSAQFAIFTNEYLHNGTITINGLKVFLLPEM